MGIIQIEYIIILIFIVHEPFFAASNNSRIVPNSVQKFPAEIFWRIFVLGILGIIGNDSGIIRAGYFSSILRFWRG